MITTMDTLQPEGHQHRSNLRMLSTIILFCAVLGAVGASSVFYFGFILVFLYLVAAVTSLVHTTDAKAVYQNTCMFSNVVAFSHLRNLYIVNTVCSCLGVFFSIGGLAYHVETGKTTLGIALSVCALVGCIVGVPVSAMAANTCKHLHSIVGPAFIRDVVAVPMGSVTPQGSGSGGVAFQEQQVYPAAIPIDPSTGQPYEAQPVGYGHPQPQPIGYGQQQQPAGASGTYPGYGQPPPPQQNSHNNGGYDSDGFYSNIQQQPVRSSQQQ